MHPLMSCASFYLYFFGFVFMLKLSGSLANNDWFTCCLVHFDGFVEIFILYFFCLVLIEVCERKQAFV